jgi:hypothetical protein
VANNFTSPPVIYTVTAEDGTSQAYGVTVTVAAPVIGQSYGGGKIAYFFVPGDTGYVAGETHGLISAAADQAPSSWSNIAGTLIGWPAHWLGNGRGRDNTTAIVGQVVGAVSCTSGAAYLCDHLVEGGYSDWFLPSRDELGKLYDNRDAIGGFTTNGHFGYWTSSELDAYGALTQDFTGGFQGHGVKYGTYKVRAVRYF